MATASAKTAVQLPTGQIMTVDDFTDLLTRGTDEVFQRGFDPNQYPFQGDKLYDSMDLNQRTWTTQTTVGGGNTPRNSDGEAIPRDRMGMGFAHSMTTVQYRKAMEWTRELLEDNLYPNAIPDKAMELMLGARRTVEEIMADGINRGLGTSGAPFLCEDGMYLWDSARPNPVAIAGTWSNLETTGALSVSMFFTAGLNFRLNRDAKGNKAVMKLGTIVIRPHEAKTMHELLGSPLEPTSALNKVNWANSAGLSYEIYDHMTTAQVIFKATDGKNELYQLWRVRPGTLPVETGDPDVFAVRTRFRYGLGCLRPSNLRAAALS